MTTTLVMSQFAIEQDRERWLKRRREGITASEIAAVLGLGVEQDDDDPTAVPTPYSSPFALFTAKQIGEDWTPDNDSMVRGRHLEPYVVEVFEARHEELSIHDGGLYSNQARPWQLATFDRIAIDPSTSSMPPGYKLPAQLNWWPDRDVMPVQIKTTANRKGWGDSGTDEIPVHYRAQCLWEMDCAGADTVIVPCLFMQEWKVKVYFINRTPDVEADIEYMRQAAEEFLQRLKEDNPPQVDWTPATTAALKTLHPTVVGGHTAVIPKKLGTKYRDAFLAKKRAERRLAQANNEILARAGDAELIVLADGTEVCRRSESSPTRLDLDWIRENHPDVAKGAERTKDVISLTRRRWAKQARERGE
jgi:putative phage-type endonuclease